MGPSPAPASDQPISSHLSSTSSSPKPKPARISHNEEGLCVLFLHLNFPGDMQMSLCPACSWGSHSQLQPKGFATQRIWGCLNCAPHGPKLGTRARPLSQQKRGDDVHLPVVSIFWSLRMAEHVQVIKLIILIKNIPRERTMHLSACNILTAYLNAFGITT